MQFRKEDGIIRRIRCSSWDRAPGFEWPCQSFVNGCSNCIIKKGFPLSAHYLGDDSNISVTENKVLILSSEEPFENEIIDINNVLTANKGVKT